LYGPVAKRLVCIQIKNVSMKISDILAKAQKLELRSEMEVFLAHLLECERLDLLVRGEEEVPVGKLAELQTGWTRILDGVPVAYLTHKKEFYGLDFYVDERVLVPRGETERLVEMVLERKSALEGGTLRVLEVGTGSGAISVSIKKTQPEIEVVAVDVSDDALSVANKNVVQHGVDVELLQSDLLENVPDGKFDGLVANLPYIGTETHADIAENVGKHEPAVALFGGPDGLQLYARLFDQIIEQGREFGWILGEIGFSQGPDMRALAEEKLPQYSCEILEDLQGLTRYFVLERQ